MRGLRVRSNAIHWQACDVNILRESHACLDYVEIPDLEENGYNTSPRASWYLALILISV